MNDNENSHKRTSDELDLDIKPESDSNNHHNLETNDLQSDPPDELLNDSSQPPAKKIRSSEELDIRFLVSSKEAGAIIGKGGANINHLRKNYKSSVTVPDCPGPERVLSIVASIETLGDILRDVIGYIDDRQHNSGERDVELRLLIHTSHAGGIIGKGGQRIRDLRDQTKAAIKVFSQCCPLSTERICAVQGSPEVVINAIKIVLDIILSSPIKGPVKLYDPFNFDVYGALDYGGHTEPVTANFRGTPRTPSMPYAGRGGARMPRLPERRPGWQPDVPPIPPPPDAWVSRMPYSGPADRRGPPHQMYSNRWLPSGDNPRPVPPVAQTPQTGTDAPYWTDVIPNDNITQNAGIHSSNSWSAAYSANDSNFNSAEVEQVPNMVENSDGSATATINVPNNVAGAIIGKGGNRIRLVRRDSGADITIDSSVGPGKERVITVKGSAHQVRMACSMIHKSIADNTRRY